MHSWVYLGLGRLLDLATGTVGIQVYGGPFFPCTHHDRHKYQRTGPVLNGMLSVCTFVKVPQSKTSDKATSELGAYSQFQTSKESREVNILWFCLTLLPSVLFITFQKKVVHHIQSLSLCILHSSQLFPHWISCCLALFLLS